MTASPERIWWTAAEIADARLPDMPTTTQKVTAMAVRLNWRQSARQARRRAGQGGGWEYHWTLFPMRAQALLIARAQIAAPEIPAPRIDRDEAWTWLETLPEAVQAKARARLATIQKAEALRDGGLTLHLAVIDAAAMDNVAPRSIWNWFSMVEGVRTDDRLPYLAPRHRAAVRSPRRAEVDPRFGDLIKSDWLRLAQPSLTSVYDRCVLIAEAQGIPTVPLHTVRRWLDRTVSATARTLARKGSEALKRMRPAQERDKTSLHALEAVNADFHRFDVFVRFPAGPGGQQEEIARPQMVAMQDIYSGKILSWRLDRVPNSQAVQLCIGDMIETWGIPGHVLMDNGREFAAKLITGGVPTRYRFKVREDDMSGLLVSLGCEVHWANPYSGQSKPIERAFRDLCDRVAKHPAFEGAYTGNRPDAKPENYGSRAVSLTEFTAVLTDELARHNARPDRRSEVAFGRSFDEVFAESYATAPIRKASAAQRRLWLMGAEGIRANSQTGQVNFMGNRYWDDWMSELAGQRIVARFDRAALWDGLHIYSMANEYLGFAPCLVKSGFFDVDDARAHKRSLKDWQAAKKAELAAMRRLNAPDVAAALSRVAAPEETAPSATVIRPVFDAPRVPTPAAPRPEEDAVRATVIADLSARRPARPSDDVGRADYIRAREIERKLERGEPVTKDQQVWLAGYQITPAYRTWVSMVADFGEGILAG